jgi:hypothetical protein
LREELAASRNACGQRSPSSKATRESRREAVLQRQLGAVRDRLDHVRQDHADCDARLWDYLDRLEARSEIAEPLERLRRAGEVPWPPNAFEGGLNERFLWEMARLGILPRQPSRYLPG